MRRSPTVEFWPQSDIIKRLSGEGCCIIESLLVSSHPAPSQLVEELLVQLLITLLASHGQEYVSSDELVNNFTICRQALENDILIVFKLDPHDPVGADSQQFLLLLSVESHHKQTNSILRQ